MPAVSAMGMALDDVVTGTGPVVPGHCWTLGALTAPSISRLNFPGSSVGTVDFLTSSLQLPTTIGTGEE